MSNNKELTIDKIKSYIIKNYPQSCLAVNDALGSLIADEIFKDCEDFFYYEKLHWCGCGSSELAKRCVRDYLNILSIKFYDRKKAKLELFSNFGEFTVCDNPLLLCLAYSLDAAKLTTHGSSIEGAWLTDEGEMFLWLLNKNKELNDL